MSIGFYFDEFEEAAYYHECQEAIIFMNKVVHCKDCRMFVDDKDALTTYCTRECKNLTVKPDDFCSYGEREVKI